MKKTVLVVTASIGFIVLSVAFTQRPPEFKNLQILPKDISERSLDSVMHHFNKSLGVKCGFCHVRNEETRRMDAASDAKPEKLIARKMMLMESGINSKYFPPEDVDKNQPIIQAITCYTCHKGEAIPVSFPEMRTDSLNRR